LGGDGRALGHQSDGGPDSCAPLPRPAPLHAEAIAETLGVARSNVSTSLKELQGWRIVKLVHVMGDKRDHFESMKDVWDMFRVVLDERKRREIDPTLALLEDCIQEAGKDKGADKHTVERLRALQDFFQKTTRWYTQISKLPSGALAKFVAAGDKVRRGRWNGPHGFSGSMGEILRGIPSPIRGARRSEG
jgi:DNA-binding transcriptional regulator GbsR (MarR family)